MNEQKEKEYCATADEWRSALSLIIEEDGSKDFPFLNVFTNLTVILSMVMPTLFLKLMTADNEEDKKLFGGGIGLVNNIREKIEQLRKETRQ